MSLSETLSKQIDHAKADLADKLTTSITNIDLLQATTTTWRDGSLGCPQPGRMYTQALVDGYKIVLQVDDAVYHYHGQTGQPPFLCPS